MMDRTLPPIQVFASDRKDYMSKCGVSKLNIESLLRGIYTDDSWKVAPLATYLNNQKAHLAKHISKCYRIPMPKLARVDFQMALTYGAYQMYCKFSANQDHKTLNRDPFNKTLANITLNEVANEVYNIINLNRMEDK